MNIWEKKNLKNYNLLGCRKWTSPQKTLKAKVRFLRSRILQKKNKEKRDGRSVRMLAKGRRRLSASNRQKLWRGESCGSRTYYTVGMAQTRVPHAWTKWGKATVHINGIRKIETFFLKKKEIISIWKKKKKYSGITIFFDAQNGSLLKKP